MLAKVVPSSDYHSVAVTIEPISRFVRIVCIKALTSGVADYSMFKVIKLVRRSNCLIALNSHLYRVD